MCAGWGDTENGVGSCVQIGIPTIICLILFSQYLRNVHVSLPRIGKMPIFALFPVLFSIAIMWIISSAPRPLSPSIQSSVRMHRGMHSPRLV